MEGRECAVRNAKHVYSGAALAIAMLLSSCVSLVPGAKQVKMTDRPAAVRGCAPVGNVGVDGDENPVDVERSLRNQAVGLGGNVMFRTSPGTGVAYRCK